MTTISPRSRSAPTFASRVEWLDEECRNGRRLITAVNHANDRAIYADPADVDEALSDRIDVGDVANELRSAGFLATHPMPSDIEIDSNARRLGDGLVWRGAGRFVRTVHRRGLHRLFERRWIVAQVLFASLGAVAFAITVFGGGLRLRAQPGQIPAIVALGLIAVFIHEFGHAIVTVHYGRTVRRAGVRLHLAAPTFYVDSVDALLLTRRQRLVQAAAGPWAEWMATSLAAFVLLAVPDGSAAATVLHRFVIINTIGILINLIPCVGLDGALLLGDIIREPDLSTRVRFAFHHRGGQRDRWLVAYALVNSIVATLLLVSSMFFWWELFGELIMMLWSSRPWGPVVVIAAGLGISLQLVEIVTTTYPELHRWLRRLPSRIAFRAERRWRVDAINAFRVLPEVDGLDAGALGLLAGRLERVRPIDPQWSDGSGHVFVRRVRAGHDSPSRVRRGDVLATDQACRSGVTDAVLLLGDWRTHLPRHDGCVTAVTDVVAQPVQHDVVAPDCTTNRRTP